MPYRNTKSLSNQNGSVLIGILIAAAMLTTLLLHVLPTIQIHSQGAKQVNLSVSGIILKANLKTLVENSAAWTSVLAASVPGGCNTALACVRNASSCAGLLAGGPGPNTPEHPIRCLYDVNGTLLYNENIATNGLDENGNSCNTYSTNPGNFECPFRLRLTFRVENCTAGNCTGKPYRLYFRFDFGPSQEMVFNSSKINFELLR